MKHLFTETQGPRAPRAIPNGRTLLLVALGMSIVCCALSSSSAEPAWDTGPDVDAARAVLEKWVETRRIISQEKRDWQLGQELLNQRIDLVEGEIEALRDKIAEAQQSVTDTDLKRDELVQENERLKDASAMLAGAVKTLEARTTTLLQRLPDPIRERVKPLSQRMPDDPDDTTLSLSERFQNVVGVLNEINKFNREITVTSEVRSLADGNSAEVTALYLGIGPAFYVGANGTIAGAGTSSDTGWLWTPADRYAAQVAGAVAILNNEQPASFVKLPVEIK